MKTAKKLIAISVLLILATLLCACGGTRATSPKKFFEGDFVSENRLLTTSQKLDLGKSLYREGSGKLAYFVDEDSGEKKTTTIVNLVSGEKIYTFTDTETVSVNGVYLHRMYDVEQSFAVVVTKTEGETPTLQSALYFENGAQLATAKGEAFANVCLDMIIFDGKVFRFDEKEQAMKQALELGELAEYDFDDFAYVSEDYYYAWQNSEKLFVAYDKELQPVCTYALPGFAQQAFFGVIDEGVVLFQYLISLPQDAEEYDIYDATEGKKQLVTAVLRVKKGETKKIESEYLFEFIVSKAITLDPETAAQMGDFDTLAMGARIRDKRVDTSDAGYCVLELKKNGSVKASVTEMYDGMRYFPMRVSQDRAVYQTIDNKAFLVDAKGKVIGEITNTEAQNEKYIVGEKKIYDYDLSVIYDFAADGYEYYESTNEKLFFSKDSEIYEYNGQMTKLIAKEDQKSLTVRDDYYVLIDRTNAETPTYTYYSANGTQIWSGTVSLQYVREYDGYYLFSGVNAEEGIVEYYRFA